MAGLCEGGNEPPGSLKASKCPPQIDESAISSTRRPCCRPFHYSSRRHLFEGATLSRSNRSPLIEALSASLDYVQLPQTGAICRRILEPRSSCPPGQPLNGSIVDVRTSETKKQQCRMATPLYEFTIGDLIQHQCTLCLVLLMMHPRVITCGKHVVPFILSALIKWSQAKPSTRSSYLLPWSPDLTTPDFFMWSFVKNIFYSQKSRNIDDLRVKITEAFQQSPLLCYNGHGLNFITVMSCEAPCKADLNNFKGKIVPGPGIDPGTSG
ncbi:hypothetical protein ANN_13357 [Periplaneta americana]|uniref:Uncharacterized protein n=1 Tax=Periplaneta americana TaxID=6978 RepID=A0ABQ8TLL1_PERAM|nr:hypothetical protein ANN_13357 [Periplaneta americana]